MNSKDFCWHRYSPKDRCPYRKKVDCESCNIRLQQVFEKNNYIYLGMPKCGSTSIHNTLGKQTDVTFLPVSEIVEKDKYIFTFVRNPWSRVLSCWNGWVKGKTNSRLFKIDGIEKGMGFKDFVYAIKDIDDIYADQHFVPLAYITEYNGNDLLDYYGKVENMEQDWNNLIDKFNFKRIMHLAKTNVGNSIVKFYNDEMIEIIETRYKKDIKKFNYNIEKIIKNNG